MEITIYDLVIPAVMVIMLSIIRALVPSAKKLNYTPLLEDLSLIVSSVVTIPMTVIGYIAEIIKIIAQAVSTVVAGLLAIVIIIFDAVKQVTILMIDFVTLKS